MDPIEKRELKRKAWLKLAAQKRRAGLLRGRVVVISLICFALLWGVVFAQMATGNDPVLSAKEGRASTRTVATTKAATRSRRHEPTGEREETAAVEAEPELEEPVEVEEAEPEVFEAEEPEAVEVEEPLVTSQS